jgi:hypothetical protein
MAVQRTTDVPFLGEFVSARSSPFILVATGGIVSTDGSIVIQPAIATSAYYIYSYAFTYVNTLANLLIIQNHTGGAERWRLNLQSPASVTAGANLAVTPPAYLFRTDTNRAIAFLPSQAQTAHYALGYWLEPG